MILVIILNALTPKLFQLERSGFINTMKKISKKTEKMWNKFIRPGLKKATPNNSAGLAAKSKKPTIGQNYFKYFEIFTRWKSFNPLPFKGKVIQL